MNLQLIQNDGNSTKFFYRKLLPNKKLKKNNNNITNKINLTSYQKCNKKNILPNIK